MNESAFAIESTAILSRIGVRVFERGWLSSNNLLFQGSEATAMVDSGYCTHSDQTVRLVLDALDGRKLDLLLNTHLHSDHCGGNAALLSTYPALQVFIPPGQAASVTNWDPVALTYEPTGQACPRFGFHGTLLPGSSIRLGDTEWEIHAAKGHDPHSVVLFEPEARILISADALWENGFGIVFPELEGLDAFDEVSGTLDLIEGLGPKIIIPGHGAVFGDLEGALQRARNRLSRFITAPDEHRRHALKVLIKFKLLERQSVALVEMLDWYANSPYLALIEQRPPGSDSSELLHTLQSLLNELIKRGAIHREGDRLINI